MGKKNRDADQLTPAETRSLQRWALRHAAEKDARAENGITGRVDYMLDEMNDAKGGKRKK